MGCLKNIVCDDTILWVLILLLLLLFCTGNDKKDCCNDAGSKICCD